MFKQKNEKEKKYKGTKIYLARIDDDIEVERLLAIVFSMIEGYIRQEKKEPEKVILNNTSYNKIMKHNKSLIDVKDNKEYILGVEIAVESKRKFKR